MNTNSDPATTVDNQIAAKRSPQKHSVEFFHIYTDETINDRHELSIDYLKSLESAWGFDVDRIVLIDNYNPTEHVLGANQVLQYLHDKEVAPRYWAFEKDMVENARALLDTVHDKHLKKSYESYILKRGKYPCSLLTASWYLTRLGRLDQSMIKTVAAADSRYQPADRLFNLLPADYREVEGRARQIILHSNFVNDADRIQDLFYPVTTGRAIELF